MAEGLAGLGIKGIFEGIVSAGLPLVCSLAMLLP